MKVRVTYYRINRLTGPTTPEIVTVEPGDPIHTMLQGSTYMVHAFTTDGDEIHYERVER